MSSAIQFHLWVIGEVGGSVPCTGSKMEPLKSLCRHYFGFLITDSAVVLRGIAEAPIVSVALGVNSHKPH